MDKLFNQYGFIKDKKYGENYWSKKNTFFGHVIIHVKNQFSKVHFLDKKNSELIQDLFSVQNIDKNVVLNNDLEDLLNNMLYFENPEKATKMYQESEF